MMKIALIIFVLFCLVVLVGLFIVSFRMLSKTQKKELHFDEEKEKKN